MQLCTVASDGVSGTRGERREEGTCPGAVSVVGYTGSIGTDESNLDLSRRRAASVQAERGLYSDGGDRL